MFEAFLIWLYLSVGKFIGFLGFVSVACLIILVGAAPFLREIFDEEEELAKKCMKYIAIFFVSWLFLYSLYPDKDDLKWIIGGALVWNGVEAAGDIKGIEQLPQNTVAAMNHFLESIQTEDKGTDNE